MKHIITSIILLNCYLLHAQTQLGSDIDGEAAYDPVRYIHHEIGYNFRLTNIQAALGVAQLEQLPEFLKRKREIYQKYVESMENIKHLEMAPLPEYSDNNHWMNLVQIDTENYSEDRETLMQRLEDNGIQTRPAWAPIHLQKPYQSCQTYRVEQAEELVENSLCLPSSTNLSDEDLANVIAQLNE